jgi:D-alanyl-D-alanine carboxypeptidase (penicillin-binding protein 5/6)
MIKKTAKRTGLLIFALIALGGAIFAFTRPMLAPGFNTQTLESSNTNTKDGETFDIENLNGEIGQGVEADSFLIFNESTGEVIAAKNSKTAVAIASITKLMTAFVVQKYGSLETVWAIKESSKVNVRPMLGLVIGDRVIIQDLVNSMLIGSANDAASALGDYITSIQEKPVIELMNDEAKKLGMNSTHFENPIGFDSEQNYSTAEDLKLLLDTIRPMTLFSSIDRKQSYAFTSENGNQYSVKATNVLIAQDPEIHAIKTGYTDEAGGAMITAIYHKDSKFVIIVLGSPDRESDTKLLKDQVIKKLGQ